MTQPSPELDRWLRFGSGTSDGPSDDVSPPPPPRPRPTPMDAPWSFADDPPPKRPGLYFFIGLMAAALGVVAIVVGAFGFLAFVAFWFGALFTF